jgi:hypothetical protein
MAEGRETIDFHQSYCKKKSQEFNLSTLHTKAKVQRPLQFKMITFWRRRRTLKESLGRTGMETQTMVKSPLVFFIKKSKTLTISWPLDWRGCFGQGVKWEAPLSFGLWRLHTIPGWRLQILYYINYFQPISLDSQQSLTTQSHGFLTSMAIVWSGP